MKKIVLGAVGPLAESAQLVDVPTTVPAAGEVLVDIDVASVNPPTCSTRSGGTPTQPSAQASASRAPVTYRQSDQRWTRRLLASA